MQNNTAGLHPCVSSSRTGFLFGAAQVRLALSILRQHRSLLWFFAFPAILAGVVFVAGCAAGYAYRVELVEWIWARPDSGIAAAVWYGFYLFSFVMPVLGALLAMVVVQSVLSAPLHDLLSERVEQLTAASEVPQTGAREFVAGAALAVAHECIRLARWLMAATVLFIIGLVIPVVGPIVAAVGATYMTIRFLAQQSLDYCMGRRLWKWSQKRDFLKTNWSATSGLGSVLALILAVPVLGWVAVPLGAVSGTLLFKRLSANQSSCG